MPFVGGRRRAGRRGRHPDGHDRPGHQHRRASRTRPSGSSRSARTSPRLRATRATTGSVFHFTVDGGADVPVAAGRCSPPIPVPVGQHTVKETVPYGFQVVGSNPVTVNVPFFNDGGEVLVNVTNAVLRAQFKVCKLIDAGSQGTDIANASYGFLDQAERRRRRAVLRQPALPGPAELHRHGRQRPDRAPERERRDDAHHRPSISESFVTGRRLGEQGDAQRRDAVRRPAPARAAASEFTPGAGPNVVTVTNAVRRGRRPLRRSAADSSTTRAPLARGPRSFKQSVAST